jgi:hypothetical protein
MLEVLFNPRGLCQCIMLHETLGPKAWPPWPLLLVLAALNGLSTPQQQQGLTCAVTVCTLVLLRQCRLVRL